eukprot:TRINITY_DN577_c0_g2_i1.p1 TRINITY_DN577_c0_g2~~TRINITY_DN577_c0_g2_i1.p1  ORF type:complete len:481 (-),score=63.84 TRINITY_DN577_c0_g2_i1:434-1876(-)
MGKRKAGKGSAVKDITSGPVSADGHHRPDEKAGTGKRPATTPATLYSLHKSTNVTETGLGTKVAKAQKVLVGKRVWEPRARTLFEIEGQDVLARICQRDVHLASAGSQEEGRGKGGSMPLVDPNIEYQRWRRFTSLRKLYQSLCRKINVDPPPVMSFERWHFSAHTREATRSSPCVDPLIPHPPDKDIVEPCLVQDLERCGVTNEQARQLVTTLAQESRVRALEMQAMMQSPPSSSHGAKAKKAGKGKNKSKKGGSGKNRGDVIVTSHKHTLDVSLRGTQKILKLTAIHHKKLRALYDRERERRGIKSGNDDDDDDDDEIQFNQALYCLLTRYHALLGHGYQAAIPEHTFDTLREFFGVSSEGFASPLNSHFANYCSAFIDTDHPFGSLGSFFDFHIKRGSVEVNPPFVSWVMVKAVKHMTALLDKAEAEAEPLCFIVVVPGWEEGRFRLLSLPLCCLSLSRDWFSLLSYSLYQILHGMP